MTNNILTSVLPFLVVKNCGSAVDFYINGLDATEVLRYDMKEGKLIAKLAIGGSEFWVGDEEPEYGNLGPLALGGTPIRMILTTGDPDALFTKALAAGATQICPVTTEETWKIGKLSDPSGHIWEIGHPLNAE